MSGGADDVCCWGKADLAITNADLKMTHNLNRNRKPRPSRRSNQSCHRCRDRRWTSGGATAACEGRNGIGLRGGTAADRGGDADTLGRRF
jgi:hypothetical protein